MRFSFPALTATLLLGCFVLAAPDAARPAAGQTDAALTRALIYGRCTGCHSLALVRGRIGRLDEAGWIGLVTRMQSNGAPVAGEEKTAIAAFLASLKSGADL